MMELRHYFDNDDRRTWHTALLKHFGVRWNDSDHDFHIRDALYHREIATVVPNVAAMTRAARYGEGPDLHAEVATEVAYQVRVRP
jgi:hypothetical protein